MKRWMQWLAALATTGLLAACGGGGDPADAVQESPTLAQALSTEPATSEFMKLVSASGMSDRLENEAAMTLLAPSNEALTAMGVDINELLKPENRAELQDFVAAHMASGVMARDELATLMPADASRAQSQSGNLSLIHI